MRCFQEEVFNHLENKIIVIAGIKKGAELACGLLRFRGYDASFFLNVSGKEEINALNGIPVVSLNKMEAFEGEAVIFTSEVLSREAANALEQKGCRLEEIYNMAEFAKGRIPLFLLKEAQQSIALKGGYWEHCKFLFESGRNVIEGGISRCLFSDGLLIVEGWLLPQFCFQEIKVYIDGVYAGSAQIKGLRKDIKKRFPVYNDENAGFYFEASKLSVQEGNCKVIVIAYKDDQIVWERKQDLKNVKIGNIIVDLLRKREGDKLFNIAEKFITIGNNYETLKYFVDYFLRISNNCFEKIFIYQLIYRLGFFNSGYMENYIKEIEKVEDIWTRMWLCEQDIAWMLFYYPEIASQSIYNWKRAAMHRIADQLRKDEDMCRMLPDRSIAKSKRVAIIVEGLADEKAASSVFELGIANEMAKKGYFVTIYVLDNSYFEKEIKTNTLVKKNRDSSVNRDYHAKDLQGNVNICYCKERSISEKLKNAVTRIQSDEPEFIVDISLGGTAAAAMFYDILPIIHIPLTGYSSGAVFDRYIAKNKALCIEENKVFHSIEEYKIWEVPINIPYNSRQQKIYDRVDFKFLEDDFIMITVGNRLQYEMDNEFASCIIKLLQGNGKYKWIIAGDKLNPEFYEIAGDMLNNGQIRLWGYESDLIALYKICNVYVNPDRAGGCGSMELAMRFKIPIALTDYPSDILPVIGRKNCCGPNYTALSAYITKLYRKPVFYKLEAQKFYFILKNKKLSMKYYTDMIVEAYKDTRRGNL